MSNFVPVEESPEFATPDPALPYAGTETGQPVKVTRIAERQRHILIMLDRSGASGATAKEVVVYLKTHFDPGSHHGSASGALSALHKAGRIARLTLRRDRYHVYVLPEYVHGRPTEEHSSNKPKEENVLGMTARKPVKDTSELAQRLEDSMEREKNLHIQIGEWQAAVEHERDAARRALDLVDSEREAHERILAEQRESAAEELNRIKISTKVQIDEAKDETFKVRETLARADEEMDRLNDAIVEGERRSEESARIVADLEADVNRLNKRPRKVLTGDESDLLMHVAHLLEQYPNDGTKDSPVIIRARVATIRQLARAVARVVSE
jgi:hypothetical protein